MKAWCFLLLICRYSLDSEEEKSMKNTLKVASGLFLAVVLTLVLSVSSFAAPFTCPKMDAMIVNTNSVWLKNVSGAPCGTLANGEQRYFLLNAANSDALLAILLTSVSLTKPVWVGALGDTPTGGDTANIIAISQ